MKVAALLLGLTFALTANAGTAFFKYEIETGMTKQCVYDHLGSSYTITLKSYQICPITINV